MSCPSKLEIIEYRSGACQPRGILDLRSRIGVGVSREDGLEGTVWAVLSVQDAGLGIPAADLPYIFERFRRGSNVGNSIGAGIGLAGAKQIVEQHGGTIRVESVDGVGSMFTVRLPLDPR